MQWQVIAGLRFLLSWFIVCSQLEPFIVNPGQDFLYKLKVFTPIGCVIGILLISGYSIAHSITKKTEGFYQRRIFRIYPLYFCAVIFSLLPFLFFGTKIKLLHGGSIIQPDLGSVVGYLMLLQGFVFGSLSSNPTLWPLGILSFTYLLTPIFIRLSSKILISIIITSASLYVGVPYFYGIIYHSKLPYYSYLGYNLPFCLFLWAWLLGFLYFRDHQKKLAKFLLFGGSLMLILNQSRTGKVAILIYLVTCLLLVYSSQIKGHNFLFNILDYLGNIAYPFYLFHRPTFIFARNLFGINNSVVLMGFSLVVGIVFYHVVALTLRFKNLTVTNS